MWSLPPFSSSDNDVRLCEIGVSRRACRIRFEGPSKASLQLLGSNKVTINDCHILPLPDANEPVSVSLTSRDLLVIQKYRFRFRYNEDSNRSEAVYVLSSPGESRRSSTNALATPTGKHRKVRMSLVRAAAIKTPSRNEKNLPPGASLDQEVIASDNVPVHKESQASFTKSDSKVPEWERPVMLNQASQHAMPPPSTPQQVFKAKIGSPAACTKSRVGNQSIMIFDSPAALTPVAQKNLKEIINGLGLSGNNGCSVADDDIEDQVLVVDDHDDGPMENGCDGASSEEKPREKSFRKNSISHSTKIKKVAKSPEHDTAKTVRRKSSFLARAWPYGHLSQVGFEEGGPDAPVSGAAPLCEEAKRVHRDSDTAGQDEDLVRAESEYQIDPLPIVDGASPRLSSSVSSPGRLGSPSFNYHGRRNISLRTKTLLRSSAALAERLQQEAVVPSDTEKEAHSTTPSSLEIASADLPQRTISETDALQIAATQTLDQEDEDEVDQSLSLVEDLAPLPQIQYGATFHSSAADRSATSKRLSMPAGLPRCFFGPRLLPLIRPNKDAEDAVASADSMTPSGQHARSQSASLESSGVTLTHDTLKQPARETVRYLLAKGSRTTSLEPPCVYSTPVAPPTALTAPRPPRHGMLRELMLVRPDNASLLEQTRSNKRGSLILTSQTLAAESCRTQLASSISLLAPQPPDVKFLLHIFALPGEKFEIDAQLKALRDIFAEHQKALLRGHLTQEEQMSISVLLAMPAAHRALLGVAASIARPSADEAAAQEAAYISSPDLGENNEELAFAHDSLASPIVDGFASSRRKKTRRGCRGGRRRGSKSFNASLQLTELAELYLQSSKRVPETIPDEPRAEAGAEAEAQEKVSPDSPSSTRLEEASSEQLEAKQRIRSSSDVPRSSFELSTQHARLNTASISDRAPKDRAQTAQISDLKVCIGRRLSRAEAPAVNSVVAVDVPPQSSTKALPIAGTASNDKTKSSKLGQTDSTAAQSQASHDKRQSFSKPAMEASHAGHFARSSEIVNGDRGGVKPETLVASKKSQSAKSITSESRVGLRTKTEDLDVSEDLNAENQRSRSTRYTRRDSMDSRPLRTDDSTAPPENSGRERVTQQPQSARGKGAQRATSPVRAAPATTRAKAASSPIKASPAESRTGPVIRRSTRTARGGSKTQLISDDDGLVAPRSEPDLPTEVTRTRSGRTVKKPALIK